MANYKKTGEYKVLMAVMNLVDGDGRVIKCAETLHSHGIDVLLVGYNAKAGKTTGFSVNDSYPFPCVIVNGISRKIEEFGNMDYGEFHRYREEQFSDELARLIEGHKSRILHTHDMHLIKVGKDVSKKTGTYWIHDLHEWVGGLTNINPDILENSLIDEKNAIQNCNHLFTVSDDIADIYQKEHNLDALPTILLNVPYEINHDDDQETIRDVLGIEENVPIGVYCGQVKETRGVIKFIHILRSVKDLHIALVTNNRGPYLEEILKLADDCGARDRVHVTGYVDVERLPKFLSTATFGFHTMPRYGNGDVALPNKLFEYIQAGLPVAVSDAKRMSRFVKQNRCGVIFDSEKPVTVTKSVTRLLSKINEMKPSEELRRKFSWQNEERNLLFPYANYFSLGEIVSRGLIENYNSGKKDTGRIPVLHGPLGSAGQPRNLSRLLTEKSHKYVGSNILTVPTKFGYSSDIYIPFRRVEPDYIPKYLDYLLSNFQIFHFHSSSFLWDPPKWKNPSLADLLYLKEKGGRIIFHFRGTEIRNPLKFAELNPFSYTSDDPYDFTSKYSVESQQKMMSMLREVVDQFCVVDNELQTYVEDSRILHRTIGDQWKQVQFQETDRPLVVHAPSRPKIKGTEFVTKAIDELKEEGLDFEYQQVVGMSNDEARKIYEKADIVVDQLLIGWYGVLSVECMALGKPVVAYIRDDLKNCFEGGLPVINANPLTIKDYLKRLISSSEMRKEYALKSREYFQKTHSNEVVLDSMEKLYDDVLSISREKQKEASIFTERMLTSQDRIIVKSAFTGGKVDEGVFLTKIKELKRIKSDYEKQIKYLKRKDDRKTRQFNEAANKLRKKVSTMEHKISDAELEFGNLLEALVKDDQPDEEMLFSTYGTFPSRMYEDMEDLWVGDQTYPVLIKHLGLSKKCVIADYWGTLDGGVKTLIHYADLVGEIDLFNSSISSREKVAEYLNSEAKLLGPISPRDGGYDMISMTPPISQIPSSLTDGRVTKLADQLKPGGYFITHFVRSHASDIEINLDLDDLVSAFPSNDEGYIIGLPDYMREKFSLLANVDRICGSKSFISWLVLERK